MSRALPATVDEFLDALKAAHRVPTDYKLAQHFGVDVQVFSNYRKKRSLPDDVMAIRIADELGLDRGYVIAMVHAERAERTKGKDSKTLTSTWRDMAEKLSVMTVAAVAVYFALPLLDYGSGSSAMAAAPMYIMLNVAALALWCAIEIILAVRVFDSQGVLTGESQHAFV